MSDSAASACCSTPAPRSNATRRCRRGRVAGPDQKRSARTWLHTGEVERRFSRAGRYLRLAEVHAEARDILRVGNLEAKVGRIDRFTSVADVVERFEGNKYSAGTE